MVLKLAWSGYDRCHGIRRPVLQAPIVKAIINFIHSICKKTRTPKRHLIAQHGTHFRPGRSGPLLPPSLPYLCHHWQMDAWRLDWDGAFVNDSIPSGLSMRVDEAPETTDLTNMPMTSDNENSVQVVTIAAFFGFSWRLATGGWFFCQKHRQYM